MEENKRLQYIKSLIGKPFSGSASPFGHFLKGEVLAADEKSTEIKFRVRKDMTNPVGTLHGGVTSAMIDDCMGVTFFVLGLEYFYPTINLNVDFFHAAFEGDDVRVKTRVVKQGKTVINLKAEVFNADEKLLAQATSNIAVSDIKITF